MKEKEPKANGSFVTLTVDVAPTGVSEGSPQ